VTFIEPRSNTCTITLELPWEVAQALADHWPEIIGPIQQALRARQLAERQAEDDRARLEGSAEINRAAWRALATECWIELQRRSNRPVRKSATTTMYQVLKEMAADRGVKAPFLQQIMNAFPVVDS